MRKTIVASLLLVLTAAPLSAQIPVIDPAAIIQIIAIVREVEETLSKTRETLGNLERMRKPLPNLGRYRLPGIPIGVHNASKYTFATDVLQGMSDGGDPDGNAYQKIVQKLQLPAGVFASLPLETRRILSSIYAGIEVLDSTSILGQWTAGSTREYSWELQRRIDDLQEEVISGVNEPTANLDKLAIAGTLRSRQQMSATQLQSAMVDMLIAQQKQKRDLDVEIMNRRLNTLQNREKMWTDEGSGDALRGMWPTR